MLKDGTIKFVKKTGDATDQIVKTKSDGSERTDSKGNAKTYIGGIQKGILKDGENFKQNDNLIQVNGTNADGTKQPTTAGIEDFARKLSDRVGHEVGGAYFSDGGKDPTAISLGRYNENTSTKSKNYGAWLGTSLNLNELGFMHTHLTGLVGLGDPYQPSPEDYEFRDAKLNRNPQLYFKIILDSKDEPDKTSIIDFTHTPREN